MQEPSGTAKASSPSLANPTSVVVYRDRELLAGRVYWPGAERKELFMVRATPTPASEGATRAKRPSCTCISQLYARMNHPVLSVCYGLERHPYTRKEHLITLLATLSLNFILSTVVALSEGGDNFSNSIALALVMWMYTKFFDFMSTCDDRCLADQEGGLVKRCLGFVGGAVNMYFVFIFVITALSLAGELSHYERGGEAMGQWFLSTIQAWTYEWLILDGALFLFFEWRQKAKWEKATQDGTAPDISYQGLLEWDQSAPEPGNDGGENGPTEFSGPAPPFQAGNGADGALPPRPDLAQQHPVAKFPPEQYPPQQYTPQQYPPHQYPPQQYPPHQYPPQQYPPQQYPPQQYPPPVQPMMSASGAWEPPLHAFHPAASGYSQPPASEGLPQPQAASPRGMTPPAPPPPASGEDGQHPDGGGPHLV